MLQMCMGEVPSVVSPSHQPPFATSDQRSPSGVLIMCEECDAACCLWRNDHAMIRWICNIKAKDEVSSDSFLTRT